MANKPLVSIVLGSYNRRAFLEAALESVRANGMDFPYEMIVVDGGSTDGSLNYLAKQKDVITIIQHNRGEWRGKKIERRSWGYFMNLGFKAAQGKYVCMISDDCLLVPDAVSNGVTRFEQLLGEGQKVGALAFYWREWPPAKANIYRVNLTFGKLFVNHGLYLRQALEDVNWVDEENYQFYFADGDLCLRMWQQGYEIVDSPDSYVEHSSHANLWLRKENRTSEKADWTFYNYRWLNAMSKDQPLFVERFYEDPYQTVKKFPWTNNLKYTLKKMGRFILYNKGDMS